MKDNNEVEQLHEAFEAIIESPIRFINEMKLREFKTWMRQGSRADLKQLMQAVQADGGDTGIADLILDEILIRR